MKCDECSWNYPEYILSGFFSSQGYKRNICGICALALSNELHGTNWHKLIGATAEGLRLAAIQWRKEYPQKVKA